MAENSGGLLRLDNAARGAVRLCGAASNYSDNRYWTFFKLPMFGCNDSSQVLKEIANCVKSFPTAYIRLVAFDQVSTGIAVWSRVRSCAGLLLQVENLTPLS